MHVDVDVRDSMALVLQPPACDRGIVIGAEARGTIPMRMVQSSRRAEHMKRAPTLDRLSTNHRCANYQRGSLVQLVGDRIVWRPQTRFVDEGDRHARP